MAGKVVSHKDGSEQKAEWFKMPLWSLAIVSILLAFAVFGDNGVLRLIQARDQRAMLDSEISQLQVARSGLLKEIDALNNDPRHIENIARKELNMVKDGEVVYQFSSAALSRMKVTEDTKRRQ